MNFHSRGWSSVYVLINEEKLERRDPFIEAYFTLSHKVILLKESVSNTKRKKVSNGLITQNNLAHFVLIGQLGKYIDQDTHSVLRLEEILESVFSIIHHAKDLIPFNCVLVECRPEIMSLYEKCGFSYLQTDDFVQMIKKI